MRPGTRGGVSATCCTGGSRGDAANHPQPRQPAAGSLPQTENALGLPVPGVRRFLIKNQVTETPEQVINIKQM